MKKLNVLLMAFVFAIALSACQPAAPVENAEPADNSSAEMMEDKKMMALEDGRYELKTDLSKLAWSAGKVVGSDYTGTVGLASGYLVVEGGEVVDGEYVVDMDQMTHDQNKPSLLEHLKNEDFFNVEKYPTSTFTVTDSEKMDNGYKLMGDLTIMEVTNPVEFVVSFEGEGSSLKAMTSFEIDRTDWDIRYGSASFFDDLGDAAIKDEIGYNLEYYFER